MSFEDVSLSAPYYNEAGLGGLIRPQSSGSKTSIKLPRGLTLSKQQGSETKVDNEGFVSKAAHSGKKITNFLSKVPVIGGLASGVGDALDVVGDVASFFGFQRPVDLDKSVTTILNPYHNQFNSTGRDMGDRLTLNPDSHLENIAGWSGVDSDEMNFNFLKGIPTYTGSFSISTSDAYDVLLYSEKVTPMEQNFQLQSTGTVGTLTEAQYGPMAYLGQYFQFWKGSMTYTFKFVKTEFHSCRLALIFAPIQYVGSVSNSQGDYCIRTIVDLRTDSEVTVTVPWLLNVPYQTVHSAGEDNSERCSGTLFVRVLNTLQAPETVAQSIDVLVYQSAGPDFEYAGLISSHNAPVFVPQSGTTVSDLMANSPSGELSNTHNSAVIGDTFVSIKELLSMFCRLQLTQHIDGDAFILNPYAYPITKCNINASSTFTFPGYGRDYFTDLSLGYSLCRGGVSINLISQEPKLEFTNAILVPTSTHSPFSKLIGSVSRSYFEPFSTGYVPPGVIANIVPSFTGPMSSTHKTRAGLDVTVPHGCITPVRRILPVAVGVDVSYNSVGPGILLDQPRYSILCERFVGTSSGGLLLRRGADDYCLGYFIGFPSVALALVPTP